MTSGSERPKESLSPQPLSNLFGGKPKSVSYSSLLEQIRNGEVSALELVPARREVRVTYPDGLQSTVSIFVNDQQILRAAEASATPLTVRDIRGEQAMAGLLGNLGLVLLLVVGLSFLLRHPPRWPTELLASVAVSD